MQKALHRVHTHQNSKGDPNQHIKGDHKLKHKQRITIGGVKTEAYIENGV